MFFKKFFRNSVLGLYWLLLLAVPLVCWADIYTTFELPKVVCFQVITGLILILWLIKLFYVEKMSLSEFIRKVTLKNKNLRLFVVLVLGFIVLVFLSVLWGIDPLGSIYGLYPRFQGAVTQLLYLFLGVILFLELYFYKDNLELRKNVRRLLNAMLSANFAISLIAVLEKLNLLPFNYWDTSSFLGRVFGTMGHPDFLAMQIILVVPIIVAKIIENKELKKGFKAWFWRKLLILNLILSLVALYYTMSRAALVSLAFGLFVFVLLFTKKVGKKISFAFMVLLPVMLLIGLLFVNVFSENPVVKNNQILNRFVFSGESLRSAEARFVVWPEVVKTIAARPILGYGPDSFGLAFQAYFPAELNNLEKLGDTSDRAHNFILDFAVQYGIAGLIYFLAFLFFVLRRLFSYLKTENENDWLYVIAIFCSLTAAFVAVMFGFFVTTNLVYIALFLAILLTFILRDKLVLEEDKLAKKIKSGWKNIIKNILNKIVFVVACFGVTVVIFIPNFNLLKADYDFRFFLNNQREHQADAINHATQAANEGNNFAFYSYEFDGYLAKNPNANYVKQALELIEHAGERNNFDAFYHYRKAEMEALAEQNDGAVFDFKEAINKMPNYAPFYFDYGKLLVQLGEKENDLVKKKNVFDEALNVLNKYLELSPKYWQWKNNLAARSPEDRDQYRIFYKLNPNFDEVFDLIKMAGH